MKILGVDSSGLTASTAVFVDGNIVAVNSVNNNKTHSQTLLPMIELVMKQAELDVKELDGIAVAEGPGSFTGLRIGAATVKGLALAINKPIIPVSTLMGLAYNFAGSGNIVCPIMDARRGQVYTAAYRFNENNIEDNVIEEINAPEAVAIEEVLSRYKCMGQIDVVNEEDRVIFLGDGVKVYEEKIREELGIAAKIAPAHLRLQNAASIAVLGAKLYEEGKTVTGAEFEPVYLRLSQAERERLDKEKTEKEGSL